MQSVKTTSHVILKAACKLYLESEDDIKTSRKMRHVRIRNVIYKVSRLITNESVAHTARIMGKDHTTVLHALKPSKRLNTEFYEEMSELIQIAVELAVTKRNNILQWDSSTCYNNNNAVHRTNTMAKHDWIYDIMQTYVYDGAGRKRKVSFEKVYNVALINGGEETVEKMKNINNLTAGQATAILSSLLRGAARRNKGVNIPKKDGGVDFYRAPEDWLTHYGIMHA